MHYADHIQAIKEFYYLFLLTRKANVMQRKSTKLCKIEALQIKYTFYYSSCRIPYLPLDNSKHSFKAFTIKGFGVLYISYKVS